MNKNEGIRNIIFDLGGVILNIDFKKAEEAFANLGINDFAALYNQFHASDLFLDLEKGVISPDEFVSKLQNHTNGITKEKIVAAWNAMLLNFPEGRIQLLLSLKKRYRIFLLSNTNAIHHEAFQKLYPGIAGHSESLDSCFERAYYSHLLGMRKPDKEIFEWVLKQNNLVPEETLFIDDTPANILAAESVNMRCIYLKQPLTIEEVLSDF